METGIHEDPELETVMTLPPVKARAERAQNAGFGAVRRALEVQFEGLYRPVGG
jgi:hypothetical protein